MNFTYSSIIKNQTELHCLCFVIYLDFHTINMAALQVLGPQTKPWQFISATVVLFKKKMLCCRCLVPPILAIFHPLLLYSPLSFEGRECDTDIPFIVALHSLLFSQSNQLRVTTNLHLLQKEGSLIYEYNDKNEGRSLAACSFS